MKKRKSGYTLIEIMMVMAIIAILSTLVISAINSARKLQRDTSRRNNVKQLQAALESYYAANKKYPVSTQAVGLSAITGVVGSSYIGDTLVDPSGDDGRYCYAANGTSKYYLRLQSEGSFQGISSFGSQCQSPANAESFDLK